ncbi:MAG TPA: glycoside hydrolase family 3 C-terminal domain-containing protein [Terracidiphilus sp.]|nr:glycoside hydrolase family 3 C-terminal domain-containing protein [Terracidiphilus sp.]
MTKSTFCIALILGLIPSVGLAQSGGGHAAAQARAKAIVSRMTLDEKISQMHGIRDGDKFRLIGALPRLNIPEFHITNGPAGVSLGSGGPQKPATALPSPTALAATWDPALAHLYGSVGGTETLALGSQLLEGPDVNIIRVPQNGRAFENYSEDPYLNSRIAVADIEGIQSAGAMANVKHFLANNQETNRNSIDEIIGERALREIYLPAFEASVKEGHVASLMCAYPRINGDFACENKAYLNDILRKEWKFDGFVISDFGATHSTVKSMEAGLDAEFPMGRYYAEPLKQAVESGQVSKAELDEALVRRYTKMIEFGMIGAQKTVPALDVLKDGLAARKIAEEGMVLLKNDGGVLPLDRTKLRMVAVIGPYAVRTLTGGGGSADVLPLYTIEPFNGIRAEMLPHGFRGGAVVIDGHDLGEAAKLAKASDVAIVMVGANEGEGADHPIDLSPDQNKLIETVAAANPKTVVVLKTGSAVLMPWLDKVAAVLEAWYPGEEDGNVVARVLFGDVNPSGKLPVSFPKSAEDTLARNPEQYPGNGKEVHYSEGIEVGYRWFQTNGIKPLFPFGYGLSYTTFGYSNPSVRALPGHKGVTVTFEIQNTGKVAGAEVAQVYLGFPPIEEGNEPPRQLKGFQKVFLEPGATKTVTITLNPRAFSYWSTAKHDWAIAPGSYKIMIGASSEDIRVETATEAP